jgi:serine protease Do
VIAGKRGRVTAALLVFGGVAFGMMLASGLQWTPPGFGATAQDGSGAVRVAAGSASGLPGFADLAEAVAPTVASIRSVSFQASSQGARGRGSEPFFDFFFGPRDRRPGPGQPAPRREGDDEENPGEDPRGDEELRSEAGGSGFLISPDGLIATNYHVIEGASELLVTLGDERREYPARVRGVDQATDLALIQIEPGRDLPFLRLGDSEGVRVGDWVMVVGNPLRLGRTVTVGVVSATQRSGLGITDASFENFLQTDAAINFGNSGGPMVNLSGEVIGVATAINFGAENVGFAVPASTLAKVLPALRAEGRVRRGYLGVNVENLDFRAQEAFGLDSGEGALVVQVNADTPAADAGLEHGDVILTVDNRPVTTTRDLIDYVSDRPPGTQVNLLVLRGGDRRQMRVTVGERPGAVQQPEQAEEQEGGGIDWLGLRYQELSPGLRSSHGVPETVRGVWVRSISPRSPLVEERVEAGDVITEVDGKAIANVADFEAAVRAARPGGYVRFYVQRFDPRSGRSAQFFAFGRVPN